jgi:3-oxoacyl-[acyl-carrier-protein] synthase II
VGLAGDARHLTAPDREGGGAARSMVAALADADLRPDAIDWISSHGTGTVYNDRMEAVAIRAVFGDAADALPVHSVKGAIGHALGAAGAIEAALGVLVIEAQTVPPTAGLVDLDPECRINVPTQTRPARVRRVLSTSSAFAGNNAALVLSREDV